MNPSPFRAGTRLGILGGGQLARMLAEAAIRMGVTPVVYADGPGSSAALAVSEKMFGSLKDESSLKAFFQKTDLAILESEFLPVDLLERCRGNVEIRPALSAVAETRDKLKQKQLFEKLGLPTAPFLPYDGSPIENWVARAAAHFEGSCVFKWGQLGYDGKGVLVMRKHGAEKDPAEIFCRGALKEGVSLFAEARVDFKRELAIVGVRSLAGEFQHYPLVISEQYRGICRHVSGPATALGVPAALEGQAAGYVKAIAESSGLVGTFAIELFEKNDGTLLINELAPRVHNSGHYTQNASATSQFENHVRAVLGLPLGSTASLGVFAMRNLLGPDGVTGPGKGAILPVAPAKAHLHWYEKDLRPFRKLGHLNTIVADADELPAATAALDNAERDWVDALRGVKR